MADVSPVAFGIFKAIKRKVIKTFRVPPKTDTSQLTKPTSFKAETFKPGKFKPADVPKQTYGNSSQQATSTANRQKIIDANKAGSKAMDEANAAGRKAVGEANAAGSAATKKANAATKDANRRLAEGNAARRTSAIRNRALAGTGVGTAAYLMSGDAKIGPVNKPSTPSTPTSSPARTPVAPTPKKEFIDWRDRPSRRDASKPFSKPTSSVPEKTGTSSVPERKGISSPGRSDSVLPTMTVTSKGPKYRDVRSGRTTAAQESKFRFRKAKAEKEARKAKTQSIAKPAEISKRYELTPQQAGDKLLNASKTLFPKKPTPAHKNPNAFTKRDLVGTDGMSAGEITKRFDTEGYTTPQKPKLVRRPGETLTAFNMRKQRTLNAERRADFLSKR